MRSLLFLIIHLSLLASCSSQLWKKKSPSPKIQTSKVETSKDKFELESFKKDILSKIEKSKREGNLDFLSNELFFKAMDASMNGHVEVSSFLFGQLYHLHPKDSYLASKYAIELLRKGESNISVKILEEIYDSSKGKEFKLGLLLAGVHTSLGHNKKAISIYEDLLSHQKDEDACVFLIQTYREEKKFKKALGTLKKCQKDFKKSAQLIYQRGRIAISQGSIAAGKKYFRQAVIADPTFTRAALSLGIIHETDSKYEKAISVYENFLDNWPDNKKVLKRLVRVFFTTEDYDRVLPYLERLSSLEPDDLNLKVRLGVLYTDSHKYDAAIGVFDEILKIVPESDKVLYYLGSLHGQKGDEKKAIEYFSKIQESSKLYTDSHVQIARFLNKRALEKDEFFSEFENFIQSHSRKTDELNLELNLLMANHLEQKSEFKRAIGILEKLKPNKLYQEDHDYYLAALLEKDNRFGEAKSLIEALLEKNPNNPHALNFLGYTLLEKGIELDLAYQYIKKAVDIRPNDGYIRDSLGWYYYKTGNIKKAYQEIKKAWSLVKNDVVITKHLAIVYQEMKKFDKAQRYFVLALENAKAENERLDVLEAMENLQKAQTSQSPVRLPASR